MTGRVSALKDGAINSLELLGRQLMGQFHVNIHDHEIRFVNVEDCYFYL